MPLEKEKLLAGEAAADLVQDGMTVGLGTGSTAAYAIRRLGLRVREGLRMRGLPTSARTEALAAEEGITLVDFSQVTSLDMTLDGADEIDGNLNLIKGGGGALFREKIVAAATKRLVIFADHTKLVQTLGAFALPVEVNPFGWQVAAGKIKDLGAQVDLRQAGGTIFLTDNQGYILDCRFGEIPDPGSLERSLAAITGVVESGLFVGMAQQAILGDGLSVRIIHPAL